MKYTLDVLHTMSSEQQSASPGLPAASQMKPVLFVEIIRERMHRTPSRPGLERVSITSGMLTKQRHTGPFRASPLWMLHLATVLHMSVWKTDAETVYTPYVAVNSSCRVSSVFNKHRLLSLVYGSHTGLVVVSHSNHNCCLHSHCVAQHAVTFVPHNQNFT